MKEEGPQSSVIISVSDPEVKKEYGGAKQYYLYTIKGQDSKGPLDIQRRYSDFDAIRNLLVKRWPGCYIPSLPSKVKLTHSDEEFLETRSKYLQKFLMEISARTYLWESDQMQIFLRNNMMDFDRVITTFWKIEPMELIYRYGVHFKDIVGVQQEKMTENIEEFNKYLTSLFVKVQELRNRSEEINNAQAKYQKKYSKFLLNVLSSYEQKFLNFYNQSNNSFIPIFSSPENQEKKNDLQQSMKEVPLKILFEELKRQKREIFAIQQSIKGYEEYTKEKARIEAKIKEHEIKISEIQNGKKSFLSKIRSISSEDDIKTHEKSLEKYRVELENITQICSYIRRILYVTEIESFKQERTSSYYKMVQHIAREELKLIEKERDFWLAVCNNSHFDFQIEEVEQVKAKRERVMQHKIVSEIKIKQHQNEKVSQQQTDKKEVNSEPKTEQEPIKSQKVPVKPKSQINADQPVKKYQIQQMQQQPMIFQKEETLEQNINQQKQQTKDSPQKSQRSIYSDNSKDSQDQRQIPAEEKENKPNQLSQGNDDQ